METKHEDGFIEKKDLLGMRQGKEVILRSENYWSNGCVRTRTEFEKDTYEYFSNQGTLLLQGSQIRNKKQARLHMVAADGRTLSTYPEEKRLDPTLTADAYFKKLASVLHIGHGEHNPYERLAVFLDNMMYYTPDGEADHWQTPDETLSRIWAGRMKGDCDDFTLMAQRILQEWGIDAKMMHVQDPHQTKAHVTCVWLHKAQDDLWLAHSICNNSLDINGHQYAQSNFDYQKISGLPREEALASLIEKFRTSTTLKLSETYTLNLDQLTTGRFDDQGQKKWETVSHWVFGK